MAKKPTETQVEAWIHGSVGWSCRGGPLPLKEMGDKRTTRIIPFGPDAGKQAVYATCPLCEAKGRETWVLIGFG